MFQYSLINNKKISGLGIAFLALAILTTVAWAGKELLSEKSITLAEAKTMADRIPKGKNHLSIVPNDSVVLQLNRYLGTPESRSKVREILKRMKTYESFITKALQAHQLPPEFIAIPFAESGFNEKNHEGVGAGLWQFIADTARKYDLKVNDQIDQRLDPTLETQAAVRLLKDDYKLFGDWGLTLLAYNAGEKKVQEGINKLKNKDVWKLANSKYQGDKDYIATVMAAALIIHNPHIADEKI